MELMESRRTLAALSKELEPLLDGWSLVPEDPENPNYDLRCFEQDGMGFGIRLDRKEDRVMVRSCDWPSYKQDEGRDYIKTCTIWPRDLYDPKEDYPEITIAISRGARAIAKEIDRRFLPDYTRIYGRCLEKARVGQEYEDRSQATWKAVCEATGHETKYHSHHVKLPGEDTGYVTIERRGDKAHLSVTVGAERVKAILKALGL